MLIRRENRTPATVFSPSLAGAALEPFGLMRNLLRWDPFRESDLNFDLQQAFTPSFDIRETPDSYVFEADLPGIRQEDLDINLTGNRLTVTGKRESSTRKEGETYFTLERSFGSFSRTFSLPEGVDANQVKAELKEGVLTLSLAKVPEVQPKKIQLSH